MQEYHSIKPEDLIFYEGKDPVWRVFPKEPTRGVVGCFTADRAPDWDIFVVMDYNKDTNLIKAIMPRIRLNNRTIELGQDKLTEKYKTKIKCTCPLPSQGDDFSCDCGAYELIGTDYKTTFIKCDNEKYKSIQFNYLGNIREFSWVYFSFIKKENQYLDELEKPTNWKSNKGTSYCNCNNCGDNMDEECEEVEADDAIDE